MTTRTTHTPSEPAWRRLYQAGSWAALVYLVLVITPMGLLAALPVPPSSGEAVLVYIGEHRVVYLTELVCFVGLSIPAVVVFAGWAVAIRHMDPGLVLLGGLFGVGSEIVALAVGSSPQSLNGGLLVLSDAYQSATTDQRAGLASAADAVVATTNAMPWAGVLTAAGILLLSVAMWTGPFPTSVAVFGALTGALGIVSETLRTTIGPAYLIYGLMLPTWFALVGWQLHRLARPPGGAEMVAISSVSAPPVPAGIGSSGRRRGPGS